MKTTCGTAWTGWGRLALSAILALSAATARGDWVAAGGTVTNYTLDGTNYTAHLFLAGGPFVVNSNLTCDVLLVGGGGGGGETIGGGGGGGGVIFSEVFAVATGVYEVTVGGGGVGGWGTGYPAGTKGGDSVFSDLTAIGGGAGAGYNVNAVGTGGSAGGNGGSTGVRAGYTPEQGNDGGLGSGGNAGGGGGGAVQAGGSASGSPVNGGQGGDGVTNSISGTPTAYAGGGGGGTRTGHGVAGAGGAGGGGAGGTGGQAGTNGLPNTGGGGGGGGYSAEMPGGAGGSGIVIVRYLQVPVTVSAPAVTNLGATNVQYTTAVIQGQVTDVGGEIPNVWFQYWLDGSASTSTVDMSVQAGFFSVPITGLQKDSTYRVRILASNSAAGVWSDVTTFTTLSGAASYYVAPTNNGIEDGSSWATAFTNLQKAVDPCTAGDTIYVKGGTYAVTSQVVWTQSGVTILGAYEGTTSSGPGAYDPVKWPTVLMRPSSAGNTRILLVDGVTSGTLARVSLRDGRHPGFPTINASPTAHTGGACVAVASCADLLLSELTVSGGFMQSYQPLAAGPGLFIVNSTNVTLADCLIENNYGRNDNNDVFRGGGLYAAYSSLLITNCTVRNNSGGYVVWTGADHGIYGGGLYLFDCRVTVAGTEIWGNYGFGHANLPIGLGAYVVGGTNLFRNCLIAGNDNRVNVSNTVGDGVYLHSGLSRFEQCTFIRNNGHGLYYRAGSVTVTNCILWDNLDDLVNFPTNSEGVLTNVFTSCIEDGDNNGVNGCFAGDPAFERGLYLAADSPCVDAGGGTAEEAGMAGLTTRADGTSDTGNADLGFHFSFGIATAAVGALHVAPTGSDANTGTNWAEAFRSVTKALSVARHGTHINIATGLYNTTVETFPLKLNHYGLELRGTNAATTVLAGGAGGDANGLLIRGLSFIRIEGLTLAQHNNHSADQAYTGGGASIGHSRLTIGSCIFRDTAMNGWHSNKGPGAGLWARDAFLLMTNCAVYGNSTPASDRGGGIHILNGELVLLDTVLSNNYAGLAGGGLHLFGNRGGNGHVVSNCLFVGNRTAASRGGAGLYVAATAQVYNCVFVTNAISGGTGAGIFVDGGSVTVQNGTLTRNHPEGIRQNTTNDILSLRSSILWDNTDDLVSSNMAATLAATWYCDIEDGDNVGTNGCVSVDPLFANPTNDFHLMSRGGRWTPGDVWVKDAVTSPCIDAGDPAADYAREPEPHGRRINMGAYGNTSQASKTQVIAAAIILIR